MPFESLTRRLSGNVLPIHVYVLETPVLKKKNRDLAKKKNAIRRAWTSSDVRGLKSLAKKKTGVAKISKALERTIGATAVKAHQLGVSLDTRG